MAWSHYFYLLSFVFLANIIRVHSFEKKIRACSFLNWTWIRGLIFLFNLTGRFGDFFYHCFLSLVGCVCGFDWSACTLLLLLFVLRLISIIYLHIHANRPSSKPLINLSMFAKSISLNILNACVVTYYSLLHLVLPLLFIASCFLRINSPFCYFCACSSAYLVISSI